MNLAIRHPVSAVLVILALLATALVFTVARPRYEPAIEIEKVDLAKVPHYSLADVRTAFAEQGIRFTRTVDDAGSDLTSLGIGPSPWDETGLWVTIFPEKGDLGIGHGEWERGIFEQRVGNVLVHYGGKDEETLAAVKRAVATLRPVVPPRRAVFVGG